jgi:hypothetical protein
MIARSVGRTPSDAHGVVYIEFLLAFFPVFLIFLGTVQLALLGAARLVVAHAAVAAARSAAVVLDDDPKYYGGEARGHVASAATRSPSPDPAPDSDAVGTLSAFAGGASQSRVEVIRNAAIAPLAAIAPDPAELARWLVGGETPSVGLAIGVHPLGRLVAGATVYARGALAVTFPIGPGASQLAGDDLQTEEVDVRVTYLFHCAVPFVSRFLCDDATSLFGSGSQARKELERVPDRTLEAVFVSRGERFKALRADATSFRRQAGYEAE